MTKKLLAGLAFAGVLAFALTSLAAAQTGSSSVTSTINSIKGAVGMEQRVEINPAGQAHLRGTVIGTSSSSIIVKTWGGSWNVVVSSDAHISSRGGKIQLSNIKVGDVVAVNGKVDANANFTITAKSIKDYSQQVKNAVKEEVRKEVKKEIEKKVEDKRGLIQKILEIRKKSNTDSGAKVQLSGEVVCLPKKNPGDVQTLECALGLKSEGKFYAIGGDDVSNLQTGSTVTLTGKLSPSVNSIYDIAGVLKVSN